MRTVTFLILALVCALSAAQNLGSSIHGTPAEDGEHMKYVRTLTELSDDLGLSEEFTLREESFRKASSGVDRVRLRQDFRGVPIRGGTLQASRNANGFYTGSVSGIYPSINGSTFDTSASNKMKELKTRLADLMNEIDTEIPDETTIKRGQLKHFHREKQIHIDADTGKPEVVYYVAALVDIGLKDGAYIRYPRALFKAGSLEVIAVSLSVQKDSCAGDQRSCPKAQGGNEKSHGLTYGPSPNVCLNTSFKNGQCVLANHYINVKSVNNDWRRKRAEVVSFDCDVVPDDKINGAFSPAADAYYYAQVFYDVLHKWGRLDRTQREPHTLYVHFGDRYPNSFWDGQSTTFGDGGDRTFSYATPEIIGHEMCHALTDSFGNLVFNKQSDAVGEAFSDICGKAVSYYVKGNMAGWKFADALMRNSGKALRHFDDPTLDGSTIASYDDYTSDTDGYVAMGIYLKAFYNIVEDEKVRFRDAFEGFVFANQIYWNEDTGLLDGACGVLRAAQDMGLDAETFRRGFGNVGIDLSEDKCSLKGSRDPIVYCEESDVVEVRHAEINSYRQARYVAKDPEGKNTKINVSVFCHGDNQVDIKSFNADGSLQSHGSSASISLAGETEVFVTIDSEDLVEVTIDFEFQ